MSDNQQIYQQDGTSQLQRLMAALSNEYVALDERTIADWLEFAQKYAKALVYYDANNEAAGDWSGFLDGEVQEMLAYLNNPTTVRHDFNKQHWLSRPHFVLLLTFLKIIDDHLKPSFNHILQRHLDHYYQKILQFQGKAAQPDQVYLIAELTPNHQEGRFPLPKGTEVFAGKDATGKDRMYRTDERLMLNHAKITKLKSVFVKRKTINFATYSLPLQFVEMLKLAIGEVKESNQEGNEKAVLKPGANLPIPTFIGFEKSPSDNRFVEQVLNVLNFATHQLNISFANLRKLMRLKQNQEEAKPEWQMINKKLEEMATAKGLTISFSDTSKDFVANFKAATGHSPISDMIYNELQNVQNVYDLYEELNFATTGRYQYSHLLSDDTNHAHPLRVQILRQFVNEHFYGISASEGALPSNAQLLNKQANDFQEMMSVRASIRREWIEMRELLSNISTPPIEASFKNIELPIFEKLLMSKYGKQLNFQLIHPIVKDIDSYYHTLLEIERYFALTMEEIQQLLQNALTIPSNKNLVYGLLTKAHQNKRSKNVNNTTAKPQLIHLNGIYAHSDATQAFTGDETENFPRWRTFGREAPNQLAKLGLAVSSPILELAEGKRKITLTIHFKELTPSEKAALQEIKKLPKNETNSKEKYKKPFKIAVSGEKEWLETTSFSTFHTTVANQLQITLELAPDFDPIIALSNDADGHISNSPAVRLLIDQPQMMLGELTAHDLFSRLKIEQIKLEVSVNQLAPSLIRNDQSELKVGKAFQPFGFHPKPQSKFYFFHPELASKKLDSLTFGLEWLGKPNNLSTHYKGYPNRKEEKNLKAKLKFFDQKIEREFSNSEFALFQTPPIIEIGSKVSFSYTPLAKQSFSNNLLENKRYFYLQLGAVDFGHTEYPNLAVQKANELAIALANKKEDLKAEDYHVNPPYTPELQGFHFSYTASAHLFEQNDTDNKAQLVYIHPFGYETLNTAKETNSKTTFVPTYSQEGYLCIGMEKLKPPVDVNLLIQMAEGSGNPDLTPPPILWEYLSEKGWENLEKNGRVLSDKTSGLLNSGIVKLRIPADAYSQNTQMPLGLHWLRISVRENSAGVHDAIGLHLHAVVATFEDQGNDLGHYTAPLPPESIQKTVEYVPELEKIEQPYKSFGGSPPEIKQRFYTRISERLRHKNRALTLWDYERLVLEAFPQVYKVKCLSGDLLSENKLGQVVVVVIPSILGIRPFDSFEPKMPINLLETIQRYLQERAAPQAEIVVRNPVYIRLKIRMSVELHADYQSDWKYYRTLLHRALQEYLAPWAFRQGADISIGGKIYPSLIINFVEKLEYIDYIKDFRLLTIVNDKVRKVTNSEMQQGLSMPRADGIWVSARNHSLSSKGQKGNGIGHMMVATDFQVN